MRTSSWKIGLGAALLMGACSYDLDALRDRAREPDASGTEDADAEPNPTPDGSMPPPSDGGSTPTPDGNMVTDAEAPSGPTASATLEALARAACRGISACESKRGDTVVAGLAPAVCHPVAVERVLVEPMQAAIDDGRLEFHATRADDCLQTLSATSFECRESPLEVVHQTCEGVFVGLVSEGNPCRDEVECSPDLVCEGESAQCEGTCAVPGAQGADCEEHADCEASLACLEGNCTPLGHTGDACNEHRQCANGFYCDIDVCSSQIPANGSCTSGESMSCASALLCVDEEMDGSPHCGADGRGAGQSCSEARPCERGLRCVEGSCKEIAELDGPCADPHACPYGTYCANETCQPLPVLGEDCEAEGSPQCQEGICKAGTCALGEVTEACTFEPDRLFKACSGFCSEADACQERKTAGASCTRDAECVSSLACMSDPENPDSMTCQQVTCSG